MATIRKRAQAGDSLSRKTAPKPMKADTSKAKPYYKLRKDPDVSADFIKQLEKKGPARPSGIQKKFKAGGKQMMKRADGSTSQRGLWDNIRAAAKRNKAAGKPGKKPTAAMLKQERKIKAKGK